MKKIFICVFMLISMFLMFGCMQKASVENEFSEITRVYFNGISSDGQMSASISVGEREEPYIIDGKHGENVDFSLLVVRFHFVIENNEITIDFFNNNEKEIVLLEFNPLNSTYMADLGYALEENGEYSVKYANYSINLKNASKEFKVDYNMAIEKSLNELGGKVNAYYKGNVFQGECYLKILSKPDGDFQDLYWIFQIVGQNESNNVLIDISDGSIILSN